MAHKDKAARVAYARMYYVLHREEFLSRNHAYRIVHRGESVPYQRAYNMAHRKEKSAYDRVYSFIHREEKAVRNRDYYQEHHKEINARIRAYQITEKGKAVALAAWARRRVLKRNSEAPLTATEWLEILKRAKGRCFYCKQKAKLTIDHVIPLSKGGQHIKENVVAACRSCNSTKHDKMWLLL